MASTSSSHQQNAFSGFQPLNKRRKVEESSRVYDAFINHRGPDVKLTLATDLYNSLKERNIRAFLDSEEKELGDSLTSTLETAISSAKVHIAIFSKGYAESPCCLAQLHLMLQSKAKIIPVFYQVEPWTVKPCDLRHIETGVYKDAFLKYETKGRYTEKIKEWKDALQSVSFVAGYEFSASSDCKEIVSAVEKEVERRIHLFVAKHPVGLHKLVEDFERNCLVDLVEDFDNQYRINRAGKEKANVVGIFGMGGVGKTTLTKELFKQKRSQYSKASFLFDVRGASNRSELPDLQSKLLHDLFGEKEHKFRSLEEGTSCLRDRLEKNGSPSFLIILDGIDHAEQLDALLPMDILTGYGSSLVIVTTREVRVLVTAGIEIAYRLKGLDREDGKELFCWYAFGQPDPFCGFEDLVEEFVKTCGGLPLSLQVLGRHVSKRDLPCWRDELEKTRETLPVDIKKRLKISIDSLDNEEKQVFLDVACFFIGKRKTMAMTIWEGSGWRSHHALETLKDKCLLEEVEITGPARYALRMHDHLRDLGREMANELSHPRRLWHPQHLKSLELKGFQTILAQTKDTRCLHAIWDESMSCRITYFIGEPEDVTYTSLLWLQLDYLERSTLDLTSDINRSIPSWIPLQNLQYLRINGGCSQRLWQSDMQAPSHLKELYIRNTFLEEFPDFLGMSNDMKKTVLFGKEFQMNISSLLGSLRMNLRCLNVMDSEITGNLTSSNTADLVIYDFKLDGELAFNNDGPSRTIMTGLENLEIQGRNLVTKILITGHCCQSLQSLKICRMENLVETDLASIKTLNFVEITDCKKLKRLSLTSDLSKLVELKIDECPELQEFTFVHLSSLERISIESCKKLKNFSEICNVTKLLEFKISEIDEPQELCFVGLSRLKRIQIKKCSNLKRLSGIADHINLTNLYIKECPQLEELPSFTRLSSLEEIKIDSCAKLQNITLPTRLIYLSVRRCRDLERVAAAGDIEECPELVDLPSPCRASCLKNLEIDSCDKLENISLPITLNNLSIRSCRNLESVAAAGDLTELTQLHIGECPELVDLPSLCRASCLKNLKIDSWDKLKNISLPITLNELSIRSCRNLESVAAAGDLTGLTQLHIGECPKLVDLSSLYRASCLEDLKINSCDKLNNISLPIKINNLSIRSCRNLDRVAVDGDIEECPELVDLPSLCRASYLKNLEIDSCDKLKNISLPIKLNELSIWSCRDLERVAAAGDLTELTQLHIDKCPELVDLPSLCTASCLKNLGIYSCDKLKNISLPITLNELSIWSCRNLERVAAAGDLTELTQLHIDECPELVDLPSLCRASCLEDLTINSCDKLKNISLPITLNKLSIWSCTNLESVAAAGDLTELTELHIGKCPKLVDLHESLQSKLLEKS